MESNRQWPASIEQQLLLHTAAPYPTPERLQRTHEILDLSPDWDLVLSLTQRHGTGSLLFYLLNTHFASQVPQEIVGRLRSFFDQAVQGNLFLVGELLQVMQILIRQEIAAVPFKGPALAERLYGNLALRGCRDLDILVSTDDAPKVREILLGLGYGPRHHASHAFQLARERDGVIFEIHWQAVGFGSSWLRAMKTRPLPVGLATVQPRLQTGRLGGREVIRLAAEDQLLLLCLHGAKHRWAQLKWLGDIAALLHVYPALDWDWLLAQAARWDIRRMFLLGLHLAHVWLAADLPAKIKQSIAVEPAIPHLASRIQSWLFEEQSFKVKWWAQPAYFRQLWDRQRDRQVLAIDHLALYGQMTATTIKQVLRSRA